MNAKSTKKILKTKTDWARLRREQAEDTPIAYNEDAPETTTAFWANDPLIPNAKTIAAMKEARKGKLASFKNVKYLMDDLNADD